MDLIIKETKADFNEYFDISNASDETKEKFETKDFLVVPSKYQDKEYYFAQEAIDFIKYCRLNDAEHTYDVLADGDISVRSLHSFDKRFVKFGEFSGLWFDEIVEFLEPVDLVIAGSTVC